MAAVRIPPTLRAEVGGSRELEARGDTVADVIDDLVERYPALGPQLLHDGELATFVNVYLGGEDIRTRDGLDTPVRHGDQLILLPAMAGGDHGVGTRGVWSLSHNEVRRRGTLGECDARTQGASI